MALALPSHYLTDSTLYTHLACSYKELSQTHSLVKLPRTRDMNETTLSRVSAYRDTVTCINHKSPKAQDRSVGMRAGEDRVNVGKYAARVHDKHANYDRAVSRYTTLVLSLVLSSKRLPSTAPYTPSEVSLDLFGFHQRELVPKN